jgi:hypothetical protein
LIVIVFDPLALCLILAGNREMAWAREAKQQLLVPTSTPEPEPEEPVEEETPLVYVADVDEKPTAEEKAAYERDDEPLTDNQIKQIRTRSNRPRTYRATTKTTTPAPAVTPDEPAAQEMPIGDFVGVPAEPDPDELLKKAKNLPQVMMPTFE